MSLQPYRNLRLQYRVQLYMVQLYLRYIATVRTPLYFDSNIFGSMSPEIEG